MRVEPEIGPDGLGVRFVILNLCRNLKAIRVEEDFDQNARVAQSSSIKSHSDQISLYSLERLNFLMKALLGIAWYF